MSITETKKKESIQVITSVQRRRHYAASQKQAIVMRTYEDGWSVSSVARECGIDPSQLYQWRRAMEVGALTGVSSEEGVVSKADLKKLQERTRRLERLLGMKTEEVEVLKEAVRLAREKKTDLACTIGRSGRFRMSAIARAMDVSRSNLYLQKKRIQDVGRPRGPSRQEDVEILNAIREVVAVRPTYGYRRVTAMIARRSTYKANHKRVCRLMKRENLLLQRHTGRHTLTHTGKVITMHSNTRWCTDAFGIQCWNGEQLQVAFSMDCCDRSILSWVTSTRGIDGELVRDLMTDTLEARFPDHRSVPHKVQWLSDNGPGYTARQTVFYGRSLGLEICTTPAYSPQSNGMAEAFVKTFKRDYVYVNDLASADNVREQLAKWFADCNEEAPHKGLRMHSPRSYLRAQNSAT